MNDQAKNIVVGVDDAAPSSWALSVAAGLAAALDARLTLVHVFVPPVAGISEIPLPVDEICERLRSESAALLADARRKVPPEIQVETVIRQGSPALEIDEVARRTAADFVVVGTHGRGRLATFVLGSTAEAVIRRAPCPVIVVAHEPRPAGAPHGPPVTATAQVPR
ncbi:MAG: universal stress protein [Phycisphaerae bacterium]|nr:universal stress protein [Tepidisphaeraceae bacterium]